jgi:hypothetical protein
MNKNYSLEGNKHRALDWLKGQFVICLVKIMGDVAKKKQ